MRYLRVLYIMENLTSFIHSEILRTPLTIFQHSLLGLFMSFAFQNLNRFFIFICVLKPEE